MSTHNFYVYIFIFVNTYVCVRVFIYHFEEHDTNIKRHRIFADVILSPYEYLFVCIRISLCVYTDVYIQDELNIPGACICKYVYICVFRYAHIHIFEQWTPTGICEYTCMYTYLRVYIHTYMNIYKSKVAYLCSCIYI